MTDLAQNPAQNLADSAGRHMAREIAGAPAAAALLCLTYPLALQAALALGCDPDRPATLCKVTQTR